MDTINCKQDIINRTLSLLREQPISDVSIEPSTDTEKLINQWWETARAECLCEIEPPFALSRQKLLREKIVDSETLEEIKEEQEELNNNEIITKKQNILYCYRIPSNCLKILDIDKDTLLIEGNYIYSNISNELILRYINQNTELYSREVKFNIALSYLLAYYICADLENTDNKIQLFFELKNQKISEARTFYYRETGIKIIRNYQWKKKW